MSQYPVTVGSKWREVDPRFQRTVVVTEVDSENGKVKIGKRWAKLSRFNGKRSGYEPISEK